MHIKYDETQLISLIIIRPVAISLTCFRSAGHTYSYHTCRYTIIGRLQILTRAPRQTFWVAGVLFPYGAQSGRRARWAAHKYAAWRQRWRTAPSAAHIGVDEFASYDTTFRLSYAKLRQYGTKTKDWFKSWTNRSPEHDRPCRKFGTWSHFFKPSIIWIHMSKLCTLLRVPSMIRRYLIIK